MLQRAVASELRERPAKEDFLPALASGISWKPVNGNEFKHRSSLVAQAQADLARLNRLQSKRQRQAFNASRDPRMPPRETSKGFELPRERRRWAAEKLVLQRRKKRSSGRRKLLQSQSRSRSLLRAPSSISIDSRSLGDSHALCIVNLSLVSLGARPVRVALQGPADANEVHLVQGRTTVLVRALVEALTTLVVDQLGLVGAKTIRA